VLVEQCETTVGYMSFVPRGRVDAYGAVQGDGIHRMACQGKDGGARYRLVRRRERMWAGFVMAYTAGLTAYVDCLVFSTPACLSDPYGPVPSYPASLPRARLILWRERPAKKQRVYERGGRSLRRPCARD
jgi:hypothetical protein